MREKNQGIPSSEEKPNDTREKTNKHSKSDVLPLSNDETENSSDTHHEARASATIKLSQVQALVDQNDDMFWTRVFLTVTGTIATVRVITILFLWYCIYWFTFQHFQFNLEDVSIIIIAITLLLICSLLNIMGLVEIPAAVDIYRGNEDFAARNLKSRGFLMSKISIIREKRSQYFQIAILKRLFVLVLRTRLVYLISERIPDRGYITACLAGLILNCIVTPSFLLSRNKYVNLVAAEFIDSCFGLYFSLFLPLQFLLTDGLNNALDSIAQASNWESQVEESVTSNVMQIDTLDRIVVFLLPFLLCHRGLSTVLTDTAIAIAEYREKKRLALEINQSRIDDKSDSVVVKVSHTSCKNFHSLQPLLSARFDTTSNRLCTLAVVGAYTYAILMTVASALAISRNTCPVECTVPLVNFFSFSNDCRCLAWTANCNSLNLHSMEDLDNHIVSDIPSDAVVIRFQQCHMIEDVPTSLYPLFKNLIALDFYDTKLSKFSLDLHIHFERLRALSILKAPLDTFPEGLRQFPNTLKEIRISRTSLRYIPSIVYYWVYMGRIYLDYNQLTQLPENDLYTAELISISGNPMTDINPHFLSPSTKIILATDMNLQQINPLLLTRSDRLNQVHLENNNITEIPESIQREMLEKWSIIGLSYNPICETNSATLLPELYNRACLKDGMCSPSCLAAAYVKNSHCESNCNIIECNFDAGDCSSSTSSSSL